MASSSGQKAPSEEVKESSLKSVLAKLRKRHIIETLAAFIAGGWLFLEFVDRILIAHYELNKKWLDVSFITLLGALICIILWRWFSGTEKRPGNVKVEVLIVPLVMLVALAIDLNLILQIAGIPGKKLLIGIVAFLLGVAWIVFKSLQWAAGLPEAGKKEVVVSPPATARPEKSIVVLPFSDLSPQKDQEYFCDGMTEEIITDLSHVSELLVISRSSAMTFKGTTKKIPEIAGELKTRYVLEGSVRKAGNDLRIAAQLIDATNDAHIWAQKFSGTLDDVFDIQEKVSRSVVKALKLMLTSEEEGKMAAKPFNNIPAYECYLKAKHEIFSFTKEGPERAVQYLQNAVDILGENATLYAGLGLAYFQLVNIGIKQEEYLDQAREYVQKAFALDPGSSQAHAVRGYIYSLEGDMRMAISHLKQAESSDPSDPDTAIWLGWFCLLMGKNQAFARFYERALRIDPVNPVLHLYPALLNFFEGRFDLAADRFRVAFEDLGLIPMIRLWYSLGLAYAKRFRESLSILDTDSEASSSDDFFMKLSGLLRATLRGEVDKFPTLLTPDVQESCKRDPQLAYHLGSFYSFLNQPKNAVDWLENAINRGICPYPLMEADPFLNNVRSEPRFKKLMERVKYEWEHFEV